jgi:hypothetical protein
VQDLVELAVRSNKKQEARVHMPHTGHNSGLFLSFWTTELSLWSRPPALLLLLLLLVLLVMPPPAACAAAAGVASPQGPGSAPRDSVNPHASSSSCCGSSTTSTSTQQNKDVLVQAHALGSSSAVFESKLRTEFPGAMSEAEFVQACSRSAGRLGFTKDNCIACVGVCRDELCGSLVTEVEQEFGSVFRFVGLAGFIFCGKTGFGAAHAHSPIEGGRQRYLYIVAPHVGISEEGEMGVCDREGLDSKSAACGALAALHAEVFSGSVNTELNMSDLEMSFIRKIMVPRLQAKADGLNMLQLTNTALSVIHEQLEAIIAQTVNTAEADYIVVTGVQIHGPGIGNNFFKPSQCYASLNGQKCEFQLS